MQVTQANYPNFKSGMEALGFTGLPAVTAVDWTQSNPLSANATIVAKIQTPGQQTYNLGPVG